MIQRKLKIGNWKVDLLFSDMDYDEDLILDLLYDNEASYDIMIEVRDLLREKLNVGFTYANHAFKYALVVTGPVSSGKEFIDTFTHELLHLAVEVTVGEGENLRGETPAYIVGDSARALSDVVCYLGCVPGSHKTDLVDIE